MQQNCDGLAIVLGVEQEGEASFRVLQASYARVNAEIVLSRFQFELSTDPEIGDFSEFCQKA